MRDSTFDPAGMKERMDAIRLKQILGTALTERELMVLQIEQNGMGCAACQDRPQDLWPGGCFSPSPKSKIEIWSQARYFGFK